MTPIARRLTKSGISLLEGVLRPKTSRHASAKLNFLLPQFQTALGTVVHATPVVESLKKSLADARVIVIGNTFAEQIYSGNPHVSDVLRLPSPVDDFHAAVAAIRSKPLFGGQPFTTLITTGNERTRITLWAMLAGPSRRAGFAVIPEFLHRPVAWDPAVSQISNNLRLLQAIGIEARFSEPKIYPSQDAIRLAEERLLSLGSARSRPRIAMVTQTSITQRKQWPSERWLALADELTTGNGADLIFVGTEKEKVAIDELRARIRQSTISVAGQTGIGDLAAIFTRCDYGITLDTGPLHVGRAVGLPMVIIAPAWSPVHEWLPVNNVNYRILKNEDFEPPAPADYIIDEVTVAEVVNAARDLAGLPQAHRDRR